MRLIVPSKAGVAKHDAYAHHLRVVQLIEAELGGAKQGRPSALPFVDAAIAAMDPERLAALTTEGMLGEWAAAIAWDSYNGDPPSSPTSTYAAAVVHALAKRARDHLSNPGDGSDHRGWITVSSGRARCGKCGWMVDVQSDLATARKLDAPPPQKTRQNWKCFLLWLHDKYAYKEIVTLLETANDAWAPSPFNGRVKVNAHALEVAAGRALAARESKPASGVKSKRKDVRSKPRRVRSTKRDVRSAAKLVR